MNDRKILIMLAQKIGSSSVQEAIGLILSMIDSIEEKNQDKDILLEYLYIASNNLGIFSGFNHAKDEISKLLIDILCISKENEKVIMKNKDYDSLTLQEFKYVMSWARRISVSAKSTKNNNLKNEINRINKNYRNDERWAVLKNYK